MLGEIKSVDLFENFVSVKEINIGSYWYYNTGDLIMRKVLVEKNDTSLQVRFSEKYTPISISDVPNNARFVRCSSYNQ